MTGWCGMARGGVLTVIRTPTFYMDSSVEGACNMNTSVTRATRRREMRLRRLAATKDLSLHKVRARTRSFWEYGPYCLVDPSTWMILRSGLLDLDEVEAVLATW